MKGQERKKEVKKEKSDKTASKHLSEYQREKLSKSNSTLNLMNKN